jgi:hypothetical protein
MPEPPRAPGGQFAKPAEPPNTIVDMPGAPNADPGKGRTAGDKVIVACKMPHGLILRVFRMEKTYEPVMGGGTREVDIARVYGTAVRIRGNTFPYGTVPNWQIVGGFAITPNVDKNFWDEWLEQNRELLAVKNRLIFAMPQLDSVVDEAKQMASLKSGLEPLDPQNLPKGIEPADRRPNP